MLNGVPSRVAVDSISPIGSTRFCALILPRPLGITWSAHMIYRSISIGRVFDEWACSRFTASAVHDYKIPHYLFQQ